MLKRLFLIVFMNTVVSVFATEKILGTSGSTGRWVKVARIQNKNPIDGSECSSFSGSINVQTDYGQTGSQQYYAIFSFGSRGGIKPLLQEFGDAAKRPVTDVSRIEWRIYTDSQGWHYLWFWQSNYSHYAVFDYKKTCATEYWTYESPPANYTQVWSSFGGARQGSLQTIGTLTINQGLGIGTTNLRSDKLAVNGNIRAKEIKVEAANWPDYVFTDGYNLPSLEEIQKYIKEKGHLPNIPSAKEVEANGIVLGEMNKLLLEKIEELTLYILEQEKKLKKMDILEVEINQIKQTLNELK